MKKLYFLSLLLVTFISHSQLYVSSNSFVYNKGTVFFVNQDIDLQANGNIYLRNEGQLLQGDATVSSANKGEGMLSVFQEGTSDNFDYNYWCSPIGNASSAGVGNEAFGITMLNRPTGLTSTSPATILPTSNNNGTTTNSNLSIARRWVYKFQSNLTYANWFFVGANSILDAGQGFTMKGTSGTDTTEAESDGIDNNFGGTGSQRYDFRGKPNDGDIPVSVGPNVFTLTGNPYPSAMHVNEFLLDVGNGACTGVAYYWEQDKSINSHNIIQYVGGYGTYAPIAVTDFGIYVQAPYNSYNIDGTINSGGPLSGIVIERKYAPIGQGFMIKGDATGGSVTLKNVHREYYKESGSLSQFERSSSSLTTNADVPQTVNSVSHIRLNTVLNNLYTRQIALAFLPEATDGVDRGIDARSPAPSDLPNDSYFFLDNNKYVIQGVSFDITKRIPIGVKATDNATFKFHVSEVINFDDNQMIYIYDAQDGSYHDVKNGDYEITLPTGIYNNRFELTFQDAALNNNDNVTNQFVILQNNANQMLTVSNPNLIDIKSVVLYDLTGKRIFQKEKLGTQNNYQFSTNGLSEAVYLVELLTSENQKIGQKIIISNTRN